MRTTNYLMINILKEVRHQGTLDDLANIIGTTKERMQTRLKHSPSILNNEWVLVRLKPVYIYYKNGVEISRDYNLEFLSWDIHRDYLFVKNNMVNMLCGDEIVKVEYEYA